MNIIKKKFFPKKGFSLIEMITSLFLLSLLLTFVFSFFTHLTKAQKKMQLSKGALLENQFFSIRMNQIFSSLEKGKPFLFLEDSSEKNPVLFFSFDNHMDPDPSFSGKLYGKLHIQNQNLTLELLAKNQKKVRIEPLFSEVKSWKVSFYNTEKNPPSWEEILSPQKAFYPSLIQISLHKTSKEKLSFAFFPKQGEEKVLYVQKELSS